MESTTKTMRVSINLSDIDCNEPLPDRIVSLSYPEFSITVGRGSQSDDAIEPRPDNAWFSSRVMSRQHATIRADPNSRILTVQDDGSMHGTFLNGLRVGKEPLELLPADILTFGAEVVRGEETYQPLKISIYFEWESEDTSQEASNKTSRVASFRNKFSVDVSDEDFDSELDDEEDVQIVSSSVREPSVEILYPSVYKPQQSQSALKDTLTTSVVTGTSSTNLPKVTDVANINVSAMISTNEAVEDDDEDENDEEDNSEDELERIRVPKSRLPRYNSYFAAHTDNNGEEIDYDSEFSETNFLNDMDEESMSAKATKDVSTTQSTPLKGSDVLFDNPAREPSPSDAALARPRVSDVSTATFAKVSNVSVPPLSSVKTSNPPPYNWDRVIKHMSTPQYAQSYGRPPYGCVSPSSYGTLNTPLYSMGYTNPYHTSTSTNPWDFSKTTAPPPPPPRPVHQYGATASFVPTSLPTKPLSEHTNTQQSRIALTSHSDLIRAQKRKADAMSEYSDDESVASSSLGEAVAGNSFESSSPADIPSSPATNFSPLSVEAKKPFTVTNDISDKDEVTSELESHEPSSAELDQILGDLLEQKQAPSFDLENMVGEYNRTEPIQEPPRKKAKTSNGGSSIRQSRTSTALKYTITALAGATIGALGTVVGLASLPSDYFI